MFPIFLLVWIDTVSASLPTMLTALVQSIYNSVSNTTPLVRTHLYSTLLQMLLAAFVQNIDKNLLNTYVGVDVTLNTNDNTIINTCYSVRVW